MEYKLKDLVNISSSKRIYYSEYQNEGIPFYRGKEIIEKSENNSVSTELFISEPNTESSIPKAMAAACSRTGTRRCVSYVSLSLGGELFDDSVIRL